MNDEGIMDLYITKAKDEHTAIAKQDFNNASHITIDAAHMADNKSKAKTELLKHVKNIGYALDTTVRKLVC